jgi:membrane fusion protein, macrolide-specific efflux system
MKKVLVIALIVIVLAAAGTFIVLKRKSNAVTYREIHPQRGTISLIFRETGTVSPRNRLEIRPQIPGRLDDILVVEGEKVTKGQVLAWMSSTDRAAILDMARSKGPEEVKKWEDAYKPTPVISPIDGFVIVRNKEPGQSVTTGDDIVVLADKLIIDANIDETDLSYVKLGQVVSISLDAFPDEKFNGRIEHIAYESQMISNVNVYEIKILALDVPRNFRSGMTATIEVKGKEKENALLVSSELITDNGKKKTVSVKAENGKPEPREVTVGIEDGKKSEILTGISDDDIILVESKKHKRSNNMRFGGMPGMGGGGGPGAGGGRGR